MSCCCLVVVVHLILYTSDDTWTIYGDRWKDADGGKKKKKGATG